MTEKVYHHTEQEYRIVYDPIPCCDGGFRPGSMISKAELEHMTRAGFRAFAAGTIISDSNGKLYVIRDRFGSNAQIMEECE